MTSELVDSSAGTFPPRDEAHAAARRGRRIRRIVVALLVVFVIAGVAGAFGYRQAAQTVSRDGLEISISYPAVTRGGLPARWTLEIRSEDRSPLPDEIEIRTTADYFELFDHHDLVPEPDATWQDDRVAWTFRPEPTDDWLRVQLDIRTQPNARWRHSATTEVVVGSVTLASFDYTTFVVP